jgi:hypothetical protein
LRKPEGTRKRPFASIETSYSPKRLVITVFYLNLTQNNTISHNLPPSFIEYFFHILKRPKCNTALPLLNIKLTLPNLMWITQFKCAKLNPKCSFEGISMWNTLLIRPV